MLVSGRLPYVRLWARRCLRAWRRQQPLVAAMVFSGTVLRGTHATLCRTAVRNARTCLNTLSVAGIGMLIAQEIHEARRGLDLRRLQMNGKCSLPNHVELAYSSLVVSCASWR